MHSIQSATHIYGNRELNVEQMLISSESCDNLINEETRHSPNTQLFPSVSFSIYFLLLVFPLPNAPGCNHSESTPSGNFLPPLFNLSSSSSSFLILSLSLSKASVTSSALTSSPALILAANSGGIATFFTPVWNPGAPRPIPVVGL